MTVLLLAFCVLFIWSDHSLEKTLQLIIDDYYMITTIDFLEMLLCMDWNSTVRVAAGFHGHQGDQQNLFFFFFKLRKQNKSRFYPCNLPIRHSWHVKKKYLAPTHPLHFCVNVLDWSCLSVWVPFFGLLCFLFLFVFSLWSVDHGNEIINTEDI